MGRSVCFGEGWLENVMCKNLLDYWPLSAFAELGVIISGTPMNHQGPKLVTTLLRWKAASPRCGKFSPTCLSMPLLKPSSVLPQQSLQNVLGDWRGGMTCPGEAEGLHRPACPQTAFQVKVPPTLWLQNKCSPVPSPNSERQISPRDRSLQEKGSPPLPGLCLRSGLAGLSR